MKKIESMVKKYLNDEVEKVHPPEFNTFILKAGRKIRGDKVPVPVLNFSFYSVLMLFITASVLSALYTPPRLSDSAARCYEITRSGPGYCRAVNSMNDLYLELRKYYTEENIK
jgi:hypothetical protein